MVKRDFKLSADISIDAKDKLLAICEKSERSRGQILERMINRFYSETFAGEKPKKKPVASSKFIKPTVTMISQYMQERGEDLIGASAQSERMYDFYEMKGWMVGKNKMKDWKAAVRNWLKGKSNETNKQATNDSGLSASRQAVLEARRQRDSQESRSPMGLDDGVVHGQVDQEEWGGRIIDMD